MLRRFSLTRTLRTLLSAATLAVCLIPLQAQDSTARVKEMAGNVSVMNGGYLKPLYAGSQIRAQEMIVTGPDGFGQFEVASDGSTFEVYPNSRVIFRPSRVNLWDLLNITIGRIKVFISHKPGGNPNEVSSPTAVISVRGTVFDVDVQDDETTHVSVDEGLVVVRNLKAPGEPVALHPGESVTVIPNQPLARAVDRSGAAQKALRVSRDVMWQVLMGRRTGPTGPIGGAGGSGPNADNGKPGTNKPGSPTGGPGSPTSGPSAPTGAPGAPTGAPGGGA